MNGDKYLPYASLLLRLTLAFTLLSGVADRFGFWGELGDDLVIWGDWFQYVNYMHQLTPSVSRGLAGNIAVLFTFLEIGFSIMLLFGLKIRWAGLGTGMLLLLFAVARVYTLGVKAVLDDFLLVSIAAGFLLACLPIYKWTRNGIKKKSVYSPY